MRRWAWFMAIMIAAPAVLAAGKKASDAAGPSSVRPFTDVTFIVQTNMQGDVTEVVVQTSPTQSYRVLTNGVSGAALREWVRFNDRPVNLKGEVTQVGDHLCLAIAGPIKDVTPSLRGVALHVSVDKEKRFGRAWCTTSGNRFTYNIETNGLSEATIKQVCDWNQTTADIEGKISQIKMAISDVRSIKVIKPKKSK